MLNTGINMTHCGCKDCDKQENFGDIVKNNIIETFASGRTNNNTVFALFGVLLFLLLCYVWVRRVAIYNYLKIVINSINELSKK
jgi:hypothetical protein